MKKTPSYVGAGERAHLRPHRGEHEADAGQRLAQLRQRLAHRGQRLLGEAGADPEPEALAVEAEALDVGGDLRRAPGGRARSPRRRGRAGRRASANVGEGLEALGAGVVVRPDRGVAELRAARRERLGDLRVEPGGDAEAPLLMHGLSRAVPRTRCAGSGGTCRRLHAAQPIAGLDELGGVRAPAWSGCRRRRRSAAPRTRSRGGRSSARARRGAGRRRRRRACRPPRPAGGCRCGRRRRRSGALAISLSSALRSASATASGDDLDPQTSPAPRGERQADRADPAVEVEDPPAAREPGHLGGDRRRAARPSRCWSERRPAWEISKRRPQISSVSRSAPSTPVGPSVPPLGPSITVWRSTGAWGSARRGGHQARLQLCRCAGPRGPPGCEARRARRGGHRPRALAPGAQARISLRAALLASEASRQSSASTTSSQRPRA